MQDILVRIGNNETRGMKLSVVRHSSNIFRNVLNYLPFISLLKNEPWRSTFYLHLIFLRDINWSATISLIYFFDVIFLKIFSRIRETGNSLLKIIVLPSYPSKISSIRWSFKNSKKKNIRLKLFPTNFTSLRKKLNPRFNPLPVWKFFH